MRFTTQLQHNTDTDTDTTQKAIPKNLLWLLILLDWRGGGVVFLASFFLLFFFSFFLRAKRDRHWVGGSHVAALAAMIYSQDRV